MRSLVLLFLLFVQAVYAQQPPAASSYTSPITSLYSSDSTPNLDFLPKKKRDFKIKEKKIPKKVFYGVRTKRGHAITGKGKGRIIEVFFYLPKPKEPDPYVPVVYWYHLRKRKVMNTPILEKDKKFARLLHGPYLKKTSYQILEDGIFYLGTKHGRWEKYDKNEVLIEKSKFFRGWTRESMISYYDQDHKKMEEIIPIEYGVRTGKYFRFYESGLLAEEGNYAENRKVGNWTEYFDEKKKRKKIIQYPKDPFDTETQPIVMKEWDAKGKIISDKASEEQLAKKKKETKKPKTGLKQ